MAKTKTELLERAEELGLELSEDFTNDEIKAVIADAEAAAGDSGDDAVADGIDRSGPAAFDLYGADGRQILRHVAIGEAKETAARVEAATGEKTKLVASGEAP